MLLRIHGIGPQTVRKVISEMPKVDKLVDNFNLFLGLDISIIKSCLSSGKLNQEMWANCRLEVESECEQARKLGITIISYLDTSYPKSLLSLKRFPVIIYTKGDNLLLSAPKKVAIVGTRTPTELGKARDKELSRWFSNQDYVIVSGLAQGCDTYAHRYAQKTIAVVAHGLDQPIYPRENQALADKIVKESGLLFSTYPLGTKTQRHNLAARDEWQSGLSNGVVVIEAGVTGGTHATIDFALKQHKPLAVLKYQLYFEDNYGNQKLLVNQAFDVLTTVETFENFDKRMQRHMV